MSNPYHVLKQEDEDEERWNGMISYLNNKESTYSGSLKYNRCVDCTLVCLGPNLAVTGEMNVNCRWEQQPRGSNNQGVTVFSI